MNTQLNLLGKRIDLAPRSHRRFFVVFIYAGFAVWIMGFLSGSRNFGTLSGFLGLVCLLALAAVAGTGMKAAMSAKCTGAIMSFSLRTSN